MKKDKRELLEKGIKVNVLVTYIDTSKDPKSKSKIVVYYRHRRTGSL